MDSGAMRCLHTSGWFYHADQDSLVKTPQQLVDIYYKSVGRNALLLLNLPPDKRGIIHENDVKVLTEFKAIIDASLCHRLGKGQTASANNTVKYTPSLHLKTPLMEIP